MCIHRALTFFTATLLKTSFHCFEIVGISSTSSIGEPTTGARPTVVVVTCEVGTTWTSLRREGAGITGTTCSPSTGYTTISQTSTV